MLLGELISYILSIHSGPTSLYITPALWVCILKVQHINIKTVLEDTRKDEIVNGGKERDL